MSTSSRLGSELGFYAVVKEIVTNYRAALGVIGLLLYGMVRVAHDSFYARFGLTPEDVGLTELVILGRAALYTALILFVVIGLAGLWFSSWSLLLAAWRMGHRTLLRLRRTVRGQRTTGHEPIDRRWRFNPASVLPQATLRRRYASHGLLSVFFFLALPIPLMSVVWLPTSCDSS
jgi:hypothetical protein